jgi:hypothetical protein
MKALLLAIGVTLGTAIILFFTLSHIGADKSVSSTIAGSALAFFTLVHDKISKALSSENTSSVTPGIVPIDRYTINPWLMLFYATITIFGVTELAGIALMLPMALALGNSGEFYKVSGFATLPLLFVVSYLVGRWTGIRSAKSGYWIILLALFVDRTASISFLGFKADADVLALYHTTFTRPGIYGVLLILSLLGLVGIVGVWVGNRNREGVYFNSLLHQVSAPTRVALTAMAFEEANANPKPGAIAPLSSQSRTSP